jgi:hypothetical protein
MDQVHGFGSWVHGIVDHSRPLILWSAAQILLKRKRIGNLILTLHLRVDESHYTRPMRAAHRTSAAAPWGGGAHRSFTPKLSEARRREVFGAKWHGGWRGPYPGWNAAGNDSKVAHGGGSPPPNMNDGERWLWCSFGFKKQLDAFLVASACFFWWRIGSSGGGAVAHDGG